MNGTKKICFSLWLIACGCSTRPPEPTLSATSRLQTLNIETLETETTETETTETETTETETTETETTETETTETETTETETTETETTETETTEFVQNTPRQQVELTSNYLTEHCKACHAIGVGKEDSAKFLSANQDLSQFWATLFSENAPRSQMSWAEAIVATLKWPDNTPPTKDQRLSNGVRYMPIGNIKNSETFRLGRTQIVEVLERELEALGERKLPRDEE